MRSSDLHLSQLIMDLNVREARREAQAHHLARLAQDGRQGWASRQTRRLLHATARLLVGAGRRLHECARPRSLLLPGELNSR